MSLKVAYSVPELARLVGISRFAMGRMLDSAGVVLHRTGRKRVVFLAEIKRAMPTLWESMQDYDGLA